MELPIFRYHPDPLKTGSVKESDRRCIVCGKTRGYIYTSHAYALKEYVDCICPWCIADGSAHDQIMVEFTDPIFVGRYAGWCDVSLQVVEEIAFRTPGFSGWQQERWFTHCGDAAAFLGRVGYNELPQFGPDAIEAIRENTGLVSEAWQTFMTHLDKDGSPAAYLFQCLHCGKYGGYTDCD